MSNLDILNKKDIDNANIQDIASYVSSLKEQNKTLQKNNLQQIILEGSYWLLFFLSKEQLIPIDIVIDSLKNKNLNKYKRYTLSLHTDFSYDQEQSLINKGEKSEILGLAASILCSEKSLISLLEKYRIKYHIDISIAFILKGSVTISEELLDAFIKNGSDTALKALLSGKKISKGMLHNSHRLMAIQNTINNFMKSATLGEGEGLREDTFGRFLYVLFADPGTEELKAMIKEEKTYPVLSSMMVAMKEELEDADIDTSFLDKDHHPGIGILLSLFPKISRNVRTLINKEISLPEIDITPMGMSLYDLNTEQEPINTLVYNN